MRTEELIRSLSVDQLAPRTPINRLILTAVLGGGLLAALLFGVLIGPRSSVLESMVEWRFVLKFVVTLGLALPAILLLLRVARPLEIRRLPWWLLLFAPAALVIGVAGELATVPSHAWSRRLVGSNALHCLTLIPMLSVASLACVFTALKRGAPASPRLAGAIGGLVCGGFSAALYALNCPDDSPLFVATWYVIAIGVVTLVASALGARLLRW